MERREGVITAKEAKVDQKQRRVFYKEAQMIVSLKSVDCMMRNNGKSSKIRSRG